MIGIPLPIAAADASTTRLCIMPLPLPFDEGDPRIAMLEEKVARRLEEGHFAVTRSKAVGEIVEQVDESHGKVFDTALGHVLRDEFVRFDQELGRRLRETLGCDARIRIRIETVLAYFGGSSAAWDGVVATISTTARQALIGGEWGWISALSLWIELTSLDGESLAFRSAGIEPLISLSLRRKVDRLPEDRWLENETALDRAIDSALGPMALHLRERGYPTAAKPTWPFAWPEVP